MQCDLPRMVMVSAAPISLQVFMRPHLYQLRKFFQVTAVCNASSDEMLQILPDGVKFSSIGIARQVSLFHDIKALFCLIFLLLRDKSQVVVSITPKAGLLSMLAAWFCRVPIRSHIYTGQVWANRTGFRRWALKKCDWLIGILATHTLTDSASQTSFLIENNVVPASKVATICDGSICGVDIERFAHSIDARDIKRRELGIPNDALVCLFIGRLNREKGVLDFADAFHQVAARHQKLHWVIVGPDEGGLQSEIAKTLQAFPSRLHFVGLTSRPEDYMSASDLLCLPSYREGFGLVVIEAAAAGIPTLASNIYGLSDAVLHEKTGLLHARGDVMDIAEKLELLVDDAELRVSLGVAAFERARNSFSSESVVNWLVQHYVFLVRN